MSMWFRSFFQKESHLKAVALFPKATSACKMKAMTENNKQRWIGYPEPTRTQKMIRFGFDKSRHGKFRISYRKCDHPQ